MEYLVVLGKNLEELINSVNKHLKDNWQPQGGPFIFATPPPGAKFDDKGNYWGSLVNYFAQAMICETPNAASHLPSPNRDCSAQAVNQPGGGQVD